MPNIQSNDDFRAVVRLTREVAAQLAEGRYSGRLATIRWGEYSHIATANWPVLLDLFLMADAIGENTITIEFVTGGDRYRVDVNTGEVFVHTSAGFTPRGAEPSEVGWPATQGDEE